MLNTIAVQSKTLPFYFYLFTTLMYIVKLNSAFLMTTNSFFFSWFYLRYLQRKGENKGDDSESFSFSFLFPSLMRPIVSPFFNIFFFICGRFVPKPTGTNQTFHDDSFVIVENDEESKERAKRHRARAVDVLNERLALLEEAERKKNEEKK